MRENNARGIRAPAGVAKRRNSTLALPPHPALSRKGRGRKSLRVVPVRVERPGAGVLAAGFPLQGLAGATSGEVVDLDVGEVVGDLADELVAVLDVLGFEHLDADGVAVV